MDPDHQQQYFTHLNSIENSSSTPTTATPFTAFVVASDGRFLRIGTDALRSDPAFASVPHLDMRRQVIFPGFTDAHAHLLALGLAHAEVDLSAARSKAEVLQLLSAFVRESGLSGDVDPGYFVMGGRWDQNMWEDVTASGTTAKPFPTAADLDAMFPNLPLALYRVDMHAIWANSAAMRVIAPIPENDPPGGHIFRDEDGNPTGMFIDNAIQLFTLHPYAQTPKSVRVHAATVAMKECVQNGLTSVHDAMLLDTDYDILQELLAKGRKRNAGGGVVDHMPLRVYGMLDAEMVCGPRNFTCPARFPVRDVDSDSAAASVSTNPPATATSTLTAAASRSSSSDANHYSSDRPHYTHPWLQLPVATAGRAGRLSMASVKLVLDGALGSWGANMLEPYSDKNSTGIEMYTRERLLQIVEKLIGQGYQVNTHAIGDKAVRDLIWALQTSVAAEEARGGVGRLRRHRIEHLQVAAPGDIATIRGWGIIPSMQPTHAASDMLYAESRLGAARLEHAYAWREAWEAAGTVALGTDFPIEEVNPMKTLHAAVTMQNAAGEPPEGWLPTHRLSRYMALRGMTWDGAYAALQEHTRGSIKEGKVADFVVVDRDLMTCEVSPRWGPDLQRVHGRYVAS